MSWSARASTPNGLGLAAVAARPDEIGDLARVFRHMAGEIPRREVFHRGQITLLRGAFLLLLVGVPFGLMPTLSRMPAEAEHHPLGVSAWLLIGGAALTLALSLARRRPPTMTPARLPFGLRVALLGTVLPQVAILVVAAHLPASVITIIVALEAVLVFILAAVLGLERPEPRRFAGVCLGLVAVGFVVPPEGDAGAMGFDLVRVPLAVLAALLAAADHPGDALQTVTTVMVAGPWPSRRWPNSRACCRRPRRSSPRPARRSASLR